MRGLHSESKASFERILVMAGHESTSPEGRLRRLWQRLHRRTDPDENVAAANRLIEETTRRAHHAFLRVLREVEREESGARREWRRAMRRKPAFADAFDSAVAEMERTIRDLRASRRMARGRTAVSDVSRLQRLRAARENLERLEGNLKSLAKNREAEAENAEQWERRAMRAVHAENDELARECLQRKKEHDFLRRLFTSEHEHGVRVIAALRELLESVNARTDTSHSARGNEGG